MIKAFATATAAASIAAGAVSAETAEAVDVDLDAYVGLWYEIARTPAPFQARCEGGVTAHYEPTDDAVRVLNRCDLAGGGVDRVEGTAEDVGGDFGRLSVTFTGPDAPGADYIVVDVGPVANGAYEWAAVVDGDGEIGWILARSPGLGASGRARAEAALEDAGIDLDQLEDTRQPPQNYDPEQR